MRDTGPIRKDLSGDTDAAAPYIGAARTLLGQVKNQMRLGGLQQLTRNTVLPDGTTIRVESRMGQDTVRIVAPTGEVTEVAPPEIEVPVHEDQPPEPPTLPPPEVEGRYLMVVYQGNKIAAVPMAAIGNPKWPIAYHATLKQSSFILFGQSFPSPVLQLNFRVPGSVSVFQAGFDLSQDVIGFPTAPASVMLGAIATGLGPHTVKTVLTGSNYGLGPIMNASGSTVWTQAGQFSVVNNQPALVQMLPSSLVDNVRGVSASGQYLGAYVATRRILGANYPPGVGDRLVFPASIVANGGIPDQYASQMNDVASDFHNIAFNWNFVFDISGNGPLDLTLARDTGDSVSPNAYSEGFLYPVLSQNGSRDSVGFTTLSPTTSIFRTSDGGVSFDTTSGSQALNSWSYSYAWTGHLVGVTWFYSATETGYDGIALNRWPLALDVGMPWGSASSRSGASSYSTPYTGVVPGLGANGLWHCSNGKHVLQGFTVDEADGITTTYHLYVDREDAAPRFQAAFGTDVSQANVFLMDVPLDVIKRIK